MNTGLFQISAAWTRVSNDITKPLLFYTLLMVFTYLSTSCSAKEPSLAEPKSAVAKKGKGLYQATCTACHNADPKKAGVIGPEIYGARLDVMTEKIKRNSYPKGYKPKRPTTIMIPLPHLTDADITAIHAYLNGK